MTPAMTATSLTTEGLEEALQIWEWGVWARPRYHQELGAKPAGWVSQMRSGYRKWSARNPIEEEYAMRLDGLIAKLPEGNKQVLVGLYAYGLPVASLPRIIGRSKHTIRSERDSALSFLYGALATG